MSLSVRSEAMKRLLGLLKTAGGFNIVSRKFKLLSDVPLSDRPAMFLTNAHPGSTVTRAGRGMPPTRTLNREIWIYFDSTATDTDPAEVLDELINSVELVLRPPPGRTEQTLGDLVNNCWIEGELIEVPGDLDGDGMAIIPIKILIP